MSKDKAAFKKAMNELHASVLDDDQRGALSVVERYSGELRRQAAELKAEVSHLQKSLVASEEHVARLQQLPQEVARLEEGLRASGNRVDMLEAQVTTLRQHLPDPIPKETEVLQTAHILTTNASRLVDYTLNRLWNKSAAARCGDCRPWKTSAFRSVGQVEKGHG